MKQPALDISYKEGRRDGPAFIFIHGMGMTKEFWTEPQKSRVGGGLLPISILAAGKQPTETLYHDLSGLGFTVLAWSQSRPVGPAKVALLELHEMVAFTKGRFSPSGIVFICHSRGGLVGRKYVEGSAEPASLVTLCTPHHGSVMATWAKLLAPLSSALLSLMPDIGKGDVTKAVKSMLGMLRSKGVKELLPGSEFLSSFKEDRPSQAGFISVGGTNPSFLRFTSTSHPDFMQELFGKVLPEELVPGRGDGQVSNKSSRLPYADIYLSFPLSHINIAFDPDVRAALMKEILGLPEVIGNSTLPPAL